MSGQAFADQFKRPRSPEFNLAAVYVVFQIVKNPQSSRLTHNIRKFNRGYFGNISIHNTRRFEESV